MTRPAETIDAALWAFAVALLTVGLLAGLALGRSVWPAEVPR